MKKIVTILLLAFGLFSITSCENHSQRSKNPKTVKVKCYRQHNTVEDNDPANDYIFWYIIQNMDGGCSYYASSTPVTNYSTVTWTKSQSLPKELENEENIEEQTDQEVEVDDLSADMQAEIDATPENFEGMTFDEMGDYEGTGDFDGSSDGSDGGFDGGFDGGDGGGGDGGGGGE